MPPLTGLEARRNTATLNIASLRDSDKTAIRSARFGIRDLSTAGPP